MLSKDRLMFQKTHHDISKRKRLLEWQHSSINIKEKVALYCSEIQILLFLLKWKKSMEKSPKILGKVDILDKHKTYMLSNDLCFPIYLGFMYFSQRYLFLFRRQSLKNRDEFIVRQSKAPQFAEEANLSICLWSTEKEGISQEGDWEQETSLVYPSLA